MSTSLPKWLVAALALTLAGSAQARLINPTEAQSRADSFRAVTRGAAPQAAKLAYTSTATRAGGHPSFYVFNYGENSGYVIVSADDRLRPILGYVDQGSFDINKIPENMKHWINGYNTQIQSFLTDPAAANVKAASTRSVADKEPIPALIKTKWNQSAPYNNMTPTWGGKHAVTGCVATAMAQIMNYHEWPEKNGTGMWTYNLSGCDATISYDFSKANFDWANMLDVYTESATEVEKNAVANLMLACGVATDMHYSVNESGAYTFIVPDALINFFGYDGNAHQIYREDYNIKDWEEVMYNELANKRPVQYDGYSTGGHSFVLDGFGGNYFFHFNWGWGGSSDGYFVLTALNPSDQGIGSYEGGYNSGQTAVIGVQRPAEGAGKVFSQAYAQGAFSFNNDTKTVKLGNWLINQSIFPNTYSFGIEIFNDKGESVKGWPSPDNSITMDAFVRGTGGWQWGETQTKQNVTYTVPSNCFSGLSAGTYRIYPTYKTAKMDWTVMHMNAAPRYAILTVDASGNTTISYPDVENVNLKASKLTTDKVTGWEGGSGLFGVVVENTGEFDFDGSLILQFTNKETNKKRVFSFNAVVPTGRTSTVYYNGDLPDAGQYDVVVKNGGTEISDPLPLTVETYTGGPILITDWFFPMYIYEKMKFNDGDARVYIKNTTSAAVPDVQVQFHIRDPKTNQDAWTVSYSGREFPAKVYWNMSYNGFTISNATNYLKAGSYVMQAGNKTDGTWISLPVEFNVWKEDDNVKGLYVGKTLNDKAYIVPKQMGNYSGTVDIPAEATINGTKYAINDIRMDAFLESNIKNIILRSAEMYPFSLKSAIHNRVYDNTVPVYLLPANYDTQCEGMVKEGIETYALAPAFTFNTKSGNIQAITNSVPVVGEITAEGLDNKFDPNFTVSTSNDKVKVVVGQMNAEGKVPVSIKCGDEIGACTVTLTPRQPNAEPIVLEVTNEEKAGVAGIEADGLRVVAEAMNVIVTGAPAGELVSVFNAAGQAVKQARSNGNALEFSIGTHGVYIVKCGNKHAKVML